MAAHPICNHREDNTASPAVRQYGHPVLLLLSVSLMLCNAGIDADWHDIPLGAGE
ncbi:MAG TPA: hypothetical protein PKH67_06130 [Rhodocyclaceae bacterium]|nr:hypothetical protein [Rhodocyclaceae bacterium]